MNAHISDISTKLFYYALEQHQLVLMFHFFHNPTLSQSVEIEFANHFYPGQPPCWHNMDILYQELIDLIFLIPIHIRTNDSATKL